MVISKYNFSIAFKIHTEFDKVNYCGNKERNKRGHIYVEISLLDP